ncbi:hypothetical protein GEMRC1_004655 [Eukaryota sp. GEM-RC1]
MEEKCELYEKYNCNEINLFLKNHDHDFFSAVIFPLLQDRFEKSFIDDFLLDNDLSPYCKFPHEYCDLNLFERVLLISWLKKQDQNDLTQSLFDKISDDAKSFTDSASYSTWIKLALSCRSSSDLLSPPSPSSSEDESEEVPSILLEDDGEIQEAELDAMPASFSFGAFPCAPPPPPEVFFGAPPQQFSAPPPPPGACAPCPSELLVNQSAKLTFLDECMASVEDTARLGGSATKSKSMFKSKKKSMPSMPVSRSGSRRTPKPIPKVEMYVEPEDTAEFVEQRYWDLDSTPFFNSQCKFWSALAEHFLTMSTSPFVSESILFLSLSPSINSLLLALAFTDLPITANQSAQLVKESDGIHLRANKDLIVFTSGVVDSHSLDSEALIVTMNFTDPHDVISTSEGDVCQSISRSFDSRKLYCCEVATFSMIDTDQSVDIIFQFPAGSIPFQSETSIVTRSVRLSRFGHYLEQFYFYFPVAGTFPFSPVRVSSKKGQLISSESPLTSGEFNIVVVDQYVCSSWKDVVKSGSISEVIDYLNDNVTRLSADDINLLQSRCSSSSEFEIISEFLLNHGLFNPNIAKYSLLHSIPTTSSVLSHFLSSDTKVIELLKPCFEFKDIKILDTASFIHIEYLNFMRKRFFNYPKDLVDVPSFISDQYSKFLNYFIRANRKPSDYVVFSFYLLIVGKLQDAQAIFEKSQTLSTQISDPLFDSMIDQRNYLKLYLLLIKGADTNEINSLVSEGKLSHHPKFRRLFEKVEQDLTFVLNDQEQLTQEIAQNTHITCKFDKSAKKLKVSTTNLSKVIIKFTRFDPEVFFSVNPFMEVENSDNFKFLKSHHTIMFNTTDPQLDLIDGHFHFDVPKDDHFLVRCTGSNDSQALNTFATIFLSNFSIKINQKAGLLTVIGNDVVSAYVKVFSKYKNNEVKFFKDGYTDRSNQFDYCSVSTGQLEKTVKFAILVIVPDMGAVIEFVDPPRR